MRGRFLAAALPAVLAVAGTARAAVITVTSLADNTVLDGQVTLREAITAANTDTSVDGSVAGSGPDEIVFATGPGVIALGGTPLPVVTQPLTLTGPGASRLAIDGQNLSRVLEIPAGVTATVSGLTFRRGFVIGNGGGILAAGTLTVSRCAFVDNVAVNGDAGAISSDGSLTVEDCSFEGNAAANGGALVSRGSLQLSGSLFRRNRTGGVGGAMGAGGALFNFGTATITRTEFSDNLGNNGGGMADRGNTILTNSTFSGNSALSGGGGYSSSTGMSLTATACTFNANRADVDDDGVGTGGGIRVGPSVTLVIQGSIVAGNLRRSVPEDVSGAVQAGSSFNVIGVDTAFTGIAHGTNGNQIGTAASPLDPRLGDFQDNGGPTFTRALLPGSPALDRGSAATCPATDQRGVTRSLDGDLDGTAVCDAGAYEAFTVSPSAIRYFTLTPCRVVDTRGPGGPTGGPTLTANTTRFFPVASACGVPADAKAVALNATVVNETDLGNLRVYPAGAAEPNASTINFVAGKTRANNAIVPLGAAGQLAVRCDMPAGSAGTTHLVIDVFGYLR